MKILDRYIIRKFLSTFFFVMALILSISVVFDVSEKIDTFIESGASLSEILFDYYLNFVIHFGNLFSALLIFISVIWFTSKMASNSEVVAILSSGVSFPRFLYPYLIGATIITGLSLYFNHYLVPRANVDRLAFKNEYMGSSHWRSGDHLHRQIEPGKLVYFQRYRSKYQKGRRFTLEKWD
jgi:lipopolysaccharide export system permease protein